MAGPSSECIAVDDAEAVTTDGVNWSFMSSTCLTSLQIRKSLHTSTIHIFALAPGAKPTGTGVHRHFPDITILKSSTKVNDYWKPTLIFSTGWYIQGQKKDHQHNGFCVKIMVMAMDSKDLILSRALSAMKCHLDCFPACSLKNNG